MQGPLSLDKIRDKPYVVVSDDVWRKFPAPQREVGQHPLPHGWQTRLGFVCAVQLLCTRAYFPRAHRKTKWLIVGSLAHQALKHVVLEKTLLKDLDLLTKTIHTDALEVYHWLYSKYAPKWQHFGYLGMVARTQLTALDHNSGTGRSQEEMIPLCLS